MRLVALLICVGVTLTSLAARADADVDAPTGFYLLRDEAKKEAVFEVRHEQYALYRFQWLGTADEIYLTRQDHSFYRAVMPGPGDNVEGGIKFGRDWNSGVCMAPWADFDTLDGRLRGGWLSAWSKHGPFHRISREEALRIVKAQRRKVGVRRLRHAVPCQH